jgi:hypothetical protein
MPNSLGGWILSIYVKDQKIKEIEPIGLLSDTHVGSVFFNQAALDYYYEQAYDYGVTKFFHLGDLVAGPGNYNRTNDYLTHTGAPDQAELVAEVYPQKKGTDTYFITGNHDEGFIGNQVAKWVTKLRDDMHYLGQFIADVAIDKRPFVDLEARMVNCKYDSRGRLRN